MTPRTLNFDVTFVILIYDSMNLAIDLGNTSIKVASFEEDKLLRVDRMSELPDLQQFLKSTRYDRVAVCSVRQSKEALISEVPLLKDSLFLNPDLPLPIKMSYDTPNTLGMDRLAAAIAGHQYFPEYAVLLIDMGTCITYDLLKDRAFQGGMISPGLRMRLKAMHAFTANLPSLEFEPSQEMVGRSTAQSMNNGVYFGILGEIEYHISQLMLKNPDLKVIMTGGDAHLFESKIKSDIFVAPELVLVGLNGVLRYNAV